ncbi:MAG: bis(5'-nucleosyl)-tetraphosphatase (symmetrical) YqeK [Spirochaetales bacterium]|nr:bis(5'-nucleosyl)-tetraphosphatase (symmetrical) YqeK [Spirochaetales bacterium]
MIVKSMRPYFEFLKNRITSKRFEHSVRVGRVCAKLARYYGEEPESAFLAGLLHDCGREIPVSELLKYVEEYQIECDDFEMKKPVLLHGKVGAAILALYFPDLAESVFRAVRLHVRGGDVMGKLDMIVYIADFIEPGRPYFKPDFMVWDDFSTLEELFLRVERTITLYYKNKSSKKKLERYIN